MRTIVPPFIQYVANLVSRIPGAKRLLKPLYYSYKEKVNNNRNRIFRLNAISVLRAFDAVMMDNNIPYSVFAGTMLGAVREKGFNQPEPRILHNLNHVNWTIRIKYCSIYI